MVHHRRRKKTLPSELFKRITGAIFKKGIQQTHKNISSHIMEVPSKMTRKISKDTKNKPAEWEKIDTRDE